VEYFLEIVDALYRITEIFLLSSRISQCPGFLDVENFEIIIELKNVNSRLLFFWDPFVLLQAALIYDGLSNEISICKEIFSKDVLSANWRQIAIDKSIKLFQSFNWHNPKRQMLEEYQRKIFG